jgi:hypothetical protein
MVLLKVVLASLSPLQVVQYLCNIAEHDCEKLKISALKTMDSLLITYCADPDFVAAGVKK